jgi:small conductance mechanosensitive channel
MQKVYEYLVTYGLQVVAAVLIFVIGRWIARLLAALTERLLVRANVEQTLTRFLERLVYIALLVFVIIAALGRLGVHTGSFVVVIGAAGLAVGLALQGSLSNFAAGVLLILFKPFKVGDFVEAAGKKGTVEKIQIFNTILNSPDNVRVIIPNAAVTGTHIMNYTINGIRRVDLVAGVSYDDDLKKARQVLEDVVAGDGRVLKDPAPVVAVSELGDSSVNFVVRPWVKCADYWNVYFDLTAKMKESLESAGLSIPFPQRDVHIKDGKSVGA